MRLRARLTSPRRHRLRYRCVQRGDVPGPGSSKQRRLRRVAAVGTAGEQARRWQELGDALDDAMRAVRSRDALADGLCRRVHELWMSERTSVLEWHPTELRAAGKLVLAASTQGGRFILPGFCAGLRAVGMREQCVPADVLRLLQHLCALETGNESPQALAGFLFRGAALGFDVAQDESVFELGEALVHDLNDSEHWAERSERAVDLWNELAWTAAQALDAGTLARRYRAPALRAAERLQQGELSLGEQDARVLRELADDEASWARAEIALLLAQPALRATLSSTHVAFRLAALIESSPQLDPRLPELFATLASSASPSGSGLEARILGAALGRRIFGVGLEPTAPLALADRIGPELLCGLLAHLNERRESCDAAIAVLCALMRHSGLRGVLTRSDVARMQPALAAALMRAATQMQVPASELVKVLGRLPPRSALAAITAVPALLGVADAVLHSLMTERLEELEPLLPDFVRCSREAARAAGTALLPTHGTGFSAEGLEAIFGALVEAGFGRDVVIAIWDSRRAGIAARLAALSALGTHTELLAEALRRRGPEMVDPPEIRMALEELRWRER